MKQKKLTTIIIAMLLIVGILSNSTTVNAADHQLT